MTCNDPFPKVVRIEPVGLCNFRCIHCPTGNIPNKRPIMRPERFSMILEQFAEKNFIPNVVVLYHGGEPLLNKNIAQYLCQLKEFGVARTVINTNASLLTEERSEELIDAGLDVLKVSFDGESAEESNNIRRNGNFISDASNLKTFYKIYKSRGKQNIRILLSNVRLVNTDEILSTVKDGGYPPWDIKLSIPEFLKQYFSDCPEIEFQSVPAMVWPGFPATQEFEILELPHQNPDTCESVFETVTIMSNGNVVACCYDLPGEIVFGNVFENSIFDIWTSEKYINFRKSFSNHQYTDMCKKCIVVSPRYLVRKSK